MMTYIGPPGYIPFPGLDRYVNTGDSIDTSVLSPEDVARLAPMLVQPVAVSSSQPAPKG